MASCCVVCKLYPKYVSKICIYIQPNPEGLAYKQLYDQVLCLNSMAISPIQTRVMSCVVHSNIKICCNHRSVSIDIALRSGFVV